MKIMKKTILYIAAVVLAFTLFPGCGGSGDKSEDLPEIRVGVNLVENPSFEEWDGFRPVGWDIRVFEGEGNQVNMYGKTSKFHMGGEYSYYLRGLFNTDKWMVVCQRHPVRPGYEVLFSGFLKTEGIKRSRGQEDNSNLYIIFYDKNGERVNDRYYADAWTQHRLGTSKWSSNRNKMEVPENARSVEIGLINQMTGYVYFDDIELKILPVLKWEEKKTKFITFQWQPERPFPEEDIKRETEMIEEIAREVGLKKIEKRIYHRLYPSEETFMEVTGYRRYKQIARWDEMEIHTTSSFEDHDMIHAILFDLGYPPFGLSKGLVFYFRAKFNGWDLHNAAKQDLARRQLPALYKTIPQDDFKKSVVSVTVPGWGSFVTFLIDRYGMDKLIELYRETNAIDEFEPFNVRFKDIYKEDFIKMDQEWRWFLLRYECDAAADTIF